MNFYVLLLDVLLVFGQQIVHAWTQWLGGLNGFNYQ